MKMAQVFSAHASCGGIVLAFALSSISSAFQQVAAPSETCGCVLLLLLLHQTSNAPNFCSRTICKTGAPTPHPDPSPCPPSLSIDEVRELSLDLLTTHVRKCSVALQAQQLQLLLPLLLQWLQSFAPDNDFIVPATQSCSELVAAVMQFAAADAVQAVAPVIVAIVQWLLQPHLQERAILYSPTAFLKRADVTCCADTRRRCSRKLC